MNNLYTIIILIFFLAQTTLIANDQTISIHGQRIHLSQKESGLFTISINGESAVRDTALLAQIRQVDSSEVAILDLTVPGACSHQKVRLIDLSQEPPFITESFGFGNEIESLFSSGGYTIIAYYNETCPGYPMTVEGSNIAIYQNKELQISNIYASPIKSVVEKGVKRLFFHVYPTADTKSKDLFIISGDRILVHATCNGYSYIEYESKRLSKNVYGWVHSEKITHL